MDIAPEVPVSLYRLWRQMAPAPRNTLQALVLQAFMFMLNFPIASQPIDFSHSNVLEL